MRLSCVCACAALVTAAGMASAQTAAPPSRTSQDSVIQRARTLVESGNPTEAKKLLDSLVQVTPSESAAYADAPDCSGRKA